MALQAHFHSMDREEGLLTQNRQPRALLARRRSFSEPMLRCCAFRRDLAIAAGTSSVAAVEFTKYVRGVRARFAAKLVSG